MTRNLSPPVFRDSRSKRDRDEKKKLGYLHFRVRIASRPGGIEGTFIQGSIHRAELYTSSIPSSTVQRQARVRAQNCQHEVPGRRGGGPWSKGQAWTLPDFTRPPTVRTALTWQTSHDLAPSSGAHLSPWKNPRGSIDVPLACQMPDPDWLKKLRPTGCNAAPSGSPPVYWWS